ncbi:ATP synthase F1 subunit gamma [Patescibacteria group bacterium]|nr:ATP synthase F1 subunit gamma [Patescibacteria group bacterium]
MPANTKEVKQRLQSINNTKKITKAMELVAASKMRKTVDSALHTRDYHTLAWNIVDRLINSHLWFSSISPVKKFFEELKETKHTTLIVFTSNRGLCGAFNSGIIKLALPYLKKNPNTELITIGNRGASTITALGNEIKLAYQKDDTAIDDSSIREIANHVYRKFRNKQTDVVKVAYTDYKSAVNQSPVIRQLYPFSKTEQVGLGEDFTGRKIKKIKQAPKNLEYLYEPNKYELLDYLTLRIGQVELYQALLESNASEHSARMVAMKNASDAAQDFADDLLLVFNKARQASITQEIAEISAGTTAVS